MLCPLAFIQLLQLNLKPLEDETITINTIRLKKLEQNTNKQMAFTRFDCFCNWISVNVFHV